MTGIDDLLAEPLPEIEDAGFSRRVAHHVARVQKWRMIVEIVAVVVTAGVVLTFLPLQPLDAMIESVTFRLGSSLPVAVAFAALVLSNFLARMVTNRVE